MAQWTQCDLLLIALAMLCAIALYLFRLNQPGQYIYDEVYHAYTAAQLAEGNPAPYDPFAQIPESDKSLGVAHEWTHPAFAKLPMQLGIKLFGNDPFGWRIANAFFGVLGIGIFFVLGRTFFGRDVATFATVLLLLDGLWFVQSRTAMNDIFLVCFVMLAYLACYHYLSHSDQQRWRYLWLTGIALGFAAATKWSAVYSFGLIGLIAAGREVLLLRRGQQLNILRPLFTLAGAFVVVPFVIYLATYMQYFSMGYSFGEWRELQRQMLVYHTNLRACHDWASPGWTWPLMSRPVWYYGHSPEPGMSANVFALGNPVSWWFYLIAVIVVAFRWRESRGQAIGLGLILVGFIGQWLPWSFSPRVSYLYHMLPAVPFGCLALAYAVYQLQVNRVWKWGYLALVFGGFLYFYPLLAAVPISAQSTDQHYWVQTWKPGSEWAYKCPAE
jgi:dolichyl-phosphate-mannose--protein O-mannosyl transferase